MTTPSQLTWPMLQTFRPLTSDTITRFETGIIRRLHYMTSRLRAALTTLMTGPPEDMDHFHEVFTYELVSPFVLFFFAVGPCLTHLRSAHLPSWDKPRSRASSFNHLTYCGRSANRFMVPRSQRSRPFLPGYEPNLRPVLTLATQRELWIVTNTNGGTGDIINGRLIAARILN
jgi:hypothetical protein